MPVGALSGQTLPLQPWENVQLRFSSIKNADLLNIVPEP